MKIKQKTTKKFNDSFHTLVENAGAYKRDITSRYNGGFLREPRLDYDELNSIYQSVPIVRRAIELITGHLLKNGVSFNIPDNPEATAEVVALAERVGVKKLMEEAALITLVNGCGGVLLVDKNQNPGKPVDLRRLKGKTPQFSVIDGRFITCTPDLDPLSPTYYSPREFQVVGMTVHPSWLNVFSGLPVTQVLKPMYKYMGMSLIENAYTAIVNDETMSRAIPNIVYRSSVVNYKIQGMKDSIKMGEEKNLLKYIATAEDSKSILNATITDGDDAVEVISRELSGLEGLDQRSAYRLSAAFGIAATVLWGKSPDGMNATGASDLETFYNFAETWQERWYPNLKWFYKVLTACVTGRSDVKFDLDYNAPNMLSPQQKAANDSAVLQNAAMMRDLGIPEGAITRYLTENDIITEDEAEEFDQLQEEMAEALPFGEPEEDELAEEQPKKPQISTNNSESPRSLKNGIKPVKAVKNTISDSKAVIVHDITDEFKEEEHPRDNFGKFTSKGSAELSEEELERLNSYTESDYHYINRYLRGKAEEFNEGMNELVQGQVDELDSIIKKQVLPKKLTVYRNGSAEMLALPEGASYEQIKNAVGRVFEDPAFMSTTMDESVNVQTGDTSIRLSLTVPPGEGRGVDIDATGASTYNEKEYLLARNTKYKVVSIQRAAAGEKYKYIVNAVVVG